MVISTSMNGTSTLEALWMTTLKLSRMLITSSKISSMLFAALRTPTLTSKDWFNHSKTLLTRWSGRVTSTPMSPSTSHFPQSLKTVSHLSKDSCCLKCWDPERWSSESKPSSRLSSAPSTLSHLHLIWKVASQTPAISHQSFSCCLLVLILLLILTSSLLREAWRKDCKLSPLVKVRVSRLKSSSNNPSKMDLGSCSRIVTWPNLGWLHSKNRFFSLQMRRILFMKILDFISLQCLQTTSR